MYRFTAFVENQAQFKHTLRNDFFDRLQPYKTRVQLPNEQKNVFKRKEVSQEIQNQHIYKQIITRFSAQSPIKRYDRDDFKRHIQSQDRPRVQNVNPLTLELEKFQQKVELANKQKKIFEQNEKKRLLDLKKRDLETNFGFFPVEHKSAMDDIEVFRKTEKLSRTMK